VPGPVTSLLATGTGRSSAGREGQVVGAADVLAATLGRRGELLEEYASVVVELTSESRTRRQTTRAWAVIRRAQRAHHREADRQHRGDRRQADRAGRADRPHRARAQVQQREVIAGRALSAAHNRQASALMPGLAGARPSYGRIVSGSTLTCAAVAPATD
jgi:hypothetical protein